MSTPRQPVYRVDGERLTPPERLLEVKIRRDALREAQRCINGPREGFVGARGVVHGEVVRGGKCQRCLDVHGRKKS